MIALAYILLVIGLYLIGWSLWGLPDIFVIMQERKAAERAMERAFQYKTGQQGVAFRDSEQVVYSTSKPVSDKRAFDADYEPHLDVTVGFSKNDATGSVEELDLYSSLEAYEAGLNEEIDPDTPYIDPEMAELMDMLEDPLIDEDPQQSANNGAPQPELKPTDTSEFI